MPLPDEYVTEEEIALILIVRAAAELNILRSGCATRGVRHDVMELEKRRLVAPSSASDYPMNLRL